MKKLILTSLLIITSFFMKAQCAGIESLTLTPPSNGVQYVSGEIITACYTMDGWSGTDFGANWIEGFEVTLSTNLENLTPVTSPTNCDEGFDAGQWIWIDGTITSTSTGLQAGPGWFFESDLGDVGGGMDGNPANDWGDFGVTCVWEFCFSFNIVDGCDPGSTFDVLVTAGADGTWGSWGSNSCGTLPMVVSSSYEPDLPNTLISQNFEDTLCVGAPNQIYSVITVPGSNSTYEWILSDGTIEVNTGDSITVDWDNHEGQFDFSVIETTEGGCIGDTISDTVWFFQNPSITLTSPPTLCDNGPLYELVSNPPGGSWIGDGITSGNYFNPVGGNDTLIYEYTDENGCFGSSILAINVSEVSQPIIVPDNPVKFEFCDESMLIRSFHVNGDFNYDWQISNGSIVVDNNNNVVFMLSPENGQFEIYLTQTNQFGCISSSNLTIMADPCETIWIPNTFTPNSDGDNDFFGVFGNVESDRFSLSIYNRWGQMVFTSENPNQMWDGGFMWNEKGNDYYCPDGTYIYYVTCKINSTEYLSKNGIVNLLR